MPRQVFRGVIFALLWVFTSFQWGIHNISQIPRKYSFEKNQRFIKILRYQHEGEFISQFSHERVYFITGRAVSEGWLRQGQVSLPVSVQLPWKHQNFVQCVLCQLARTRSESGKTFERAVVVLHEIPRFWEAVQLLLDTETPELMAFFEVNVRLQLIQRVAQRWDERFVTRKNLVKEFPPIVQVLHYEVVFGLSFTPQKWKLVNWKLFACLWVVVDKCHHSEIVSQGESIQDIGDRWTASFPCFDVNQTYRFVWMFLFAVRTFCDVWWARGLVRRNGGREFWWNWFCTRSFVLKKLSVGSIERWFVGNWRSTGRNRCVCGFHWWRTRGFEQRVWMWSEKGFIAIPKDHTSVVIQDQTNTHRHSQQFETLKRPERDSWEGSCVCVTQAKQEAHVSHKNCTSAAAVVTKMRFPPASGGFNGVSHLGWSDCVKIHSGSYSKRMLVSVFVQLTCITPKICSPFHLPLPWMADKHRISCVWWSKHGAKSWPEVRGCFHTRCDVFQRLCQWAWHRTEALQGRIQCSVVRSLPVKLTYVRTVRVFHPFCCAVMWSRFLFNVGSVKLLWKASGLKRHKRWLMRAWAICRAYERIDRVQAAFPTSCFPYFKLEQFDDLLFLQCLFSLQQRGARDLHFLCVFAVGCTAWT